VENPKVWTCCCCVVTHELGLLAISGDLVVDAAASGTRRRTRLGHTVQQRCSPFSNVCTTIFDKVLVTAVKDLAHTRSEHVYCKLEKAATVRTTVFLSVGVFWFPYSWSVTASNSCSVTAPTRTWRRLQLVLGDGSNSYLATAPTRTWRRLQLVLGDGSNSYLATLAPTPNPGQVLVVVLAAAGDGVLLSAGGDQEGGSPGSATRAASLTRTGRSSPEVR
jgi:hypothetical protein